METITMKVKGMTCGGCVASVKQALRGLDGVGTVDVSLERGEATVEFEKTRVGEADLRRAIEEAGFDTP